MDRSLWYLLYLRFKAWFRRWTRNLTTTKGILLTIVGGIMFAGWISSLVFAAVVRQRELQLDQIRRFGPLALLAYTGMALTLSTGEKALYYTPPEVDFLFTGPYPRRMLLHFKLIASTLGIVLTSVFVGLAFLQFSPHYYSSFFGVLLELTFINLLTIALSLITSTVGKFAWNVRRVVVGVVLALLVGSFLVSVGSEVMLLEPRQLLERFEASPVLQALLTPFRWFIQVNTAERVYPDLLQGVGLSLLVLLPLVLIVTRLDALDLETTSAASARVYTKIQAMRRGGGLAAVAAPKSGRKLVEFPMFPFLGGAGPTFWRQWTSVAREPKRLVVLVLLALLPSLMIVVIGLTKGKNDAELDKLPMIVQGLVTWMTFFLPPMIPYDFRGDVDRMEELKALPLSATALTFGQILTPMLILLVPQFLTSYAALALVPSPEAYLWFVPLAYIPVNFLLIGIENLLFLWFPSRTQVAASADFTAFGRQILIMFSKVISLGVSIGISAGIAALVYLFLGKSWPLAFVVGWLLLCGFALALVPLVAMAFKQFDVSRDIPG